MKLSATGIVRNVYEYFRRERGVYTSARMTAAATGLTEADVADILGLELDRMQGN